MLNSIILLGGLVSAFGLGAISPNQEKQDNIQFKLENHKSVQYDDNNHQITLSADELNNYHWDNLNSYFIALENEHSEDFDFSGYFNFFYAGDDFGVDEAYGNDNYFYLSLDADSVAITFNDVSNNNHFVLFDEEYIDFDDSLSISTGETEYLSFKQAIELDIQANESNINDGIFETLTDSVVAFVGSLGSGILSMTNIFYDSVNNQLTAIGLLSVIVVAVSLTYFLFRLIIGLIRMRG